MSRKAERLDVGSLVADPQNRRKHNPRNLRMVADALRDVGAARSIVIDEDNVVLAGNGVTAAAAEAGITKVRVIEAAGDELIAVRRSGLTAKQKRALAIYDNRAGELAEWDITQLLADQAAGLDLQPFFTEKELADVLGGPRRSRGNTDPDEIPEERQTSVSPGDVYKLGAHRIACGDSTDAETVGMLIDGADVAACITDPPYSVNYDRSLAARGGNAEAHGAYIEAGLKPTDILKFMQLLPCDVLVMSYPVDRHFFALADAFRSSEFDVRNELVWVKNRFSFWPSAKYQQKHEPILVCARKGRPLNADVPANVSTVFEFPVPVAHDLHPTQKPIDLWCRLLEYHTPKGGGVYEPFSGSGTTIMAAEQLDRRCYAIEKSPQYVQVAIDRWESFTGQKAVKVGDARS